MKIAILGATGRVGKQILQLAINDGHSVTALVRTPSQLEDHEQLTIIPGNARDLHAVEQTLKGADVVVSALSTDKTTTLTDAMPHIIQTMEYAAIRRIVTIGTAGILDSRIEPGKFRYETSESKRRLTFAADQHRQVYEMLHASGLDWTIVCPTYLPDGNARGNYRVEQNLLPEGGKEITVGDTAEFAYDVITQDKWIRHRVGIAY